MFYLQNGDIYATGLSTLCTNDEQAGMNKLNVVASRYIGGYYLFNNLLFKCGESVPVKQELI